MTVSLCIKNASLTHCDKNIFSHLNLSVPASKWVALLGPACIGKSGFLRMIAGKSNSDEKVFFQLASDNNLPIQQQCTLMTANDQLQSWLTIFDNILISLQLNEHTPQEQEYKRQHASNLLNQFGMSDVSHCYPNQLPAYLRQRVTLIRTLVESKPIVLMDEPFGKLEPMERLKLYELTAKALLGKTVIFITQEPTEALRYANEIFVMQGEPVNLNSIASFSTPIPRELPDPQLTAIYTTLFSQLSPVTI